MASAISLTGERPLGKWERLCRERMERDHATARERGFRFEEDEARAAVEFFATYCRHHKGEWAGKPLELAPWQSENIRELFGWQHQDTGLRRFRSAWWETGRKSGKTQIAAGIGLRLLVADGEEGGEVYFTATKREQAMIGYVAACQMVKRSPELARFVRVPRGFLRGATMVCDRLGAKMEPLSADHNTADGTSPSCDIRDEVHAWKDHALAAVLQTAQGARRQPLTLEVTTAGTFDPHSVGWQHHDYACNVLSGVFEDDSQFAYIAAADEGDDPFDPVTWWKANPNLGVSPKLDYIAKQAEKAKRQPSFFNDFLRLHLGVWTRQVTRWLPMDRWFEGDKRALNAGEYAAWLDTLNGRECYGGLDLASKLDLTAFVLEFPFSDGTIALVARFWMPETAIEKHVHEGRGFYAQWVDQGWLAATPGDVIDYQWIRREINALSQRFDIRRIGYDPWGATQLATQLREEDGLEMAETRQGYGTLSEPSKDFEAKVTARRVLHGGHPILRWNADNAVVKRDPAANLKPDKEKAKDKIDGIVAAIIAHSCAIRLADGEFHPVDGGFAAL